jgi:phosphohistidine phosphatase
MTVYFLRHADAEPDAARDFERKLTPKGLEQAEKAGKFLVRHGLVPALILTSPVVRARQTAKIVARRLGDADLVEERWLACGMSPESCLRELAVHQHLESVLLVGHEPDFSETISALTGLPDPVNLNIRKASLTAVDLPRLEPGAGQLQFLVPSRLM